MKLFTPAILFFALNCFHNQLKAQSPKDFITLYAIGQKAPSDHFTGNVWVNSFAGPADGVNCSMGSVTFAPGARTFWHSHAGGQVLIVTKGIGYYQEYGQPLKIIKAGDVIICRPNVTHWHGATPDNPMTHIATVPDADKGAVTWKQEVTELEYKTGK